MVCYICSLVEMDVSNKYAAVLVVIFFNMIVTEKHPCMDARSRTRTPLTSRPLDLLYFSFFLVGTFDASFNQIFMTAILDPYTSYATPRYPASLSNMVISPISPIAAANISFNVE
jgi:hypothetical protein